MAHHLRQAGVGAGAHHPSRHLEEVLHQVVEAVHLPCPHRHHQEVVRLVEVALLWVEEGRLSFK